MEQVKISSRKGFQAFTAFAQKTDGERRWALGRGAHGRDMLLFPRADLPEVTARLAAWMHQTRSIQLCDAFLWAQSGSFAEEERRELACRVRERLREEKRTLEGMIQEGLMDQLADAAEISLDGFTTFCLRDYDKAVEALFDACVEEYLAEQDYLEFLELLQYFVAVEESQLDCLTVVAEPDGRYRFYDGCDREITTACTQEFMQAFADQEATQDDLLLSLLVLLLPEEIFLYGTEGMKNRNLLKTLQAVFGPRLHLFSKASMFDKNGL